MLRKELVASTERTLEFARVEARDISMNIQNKAYHAIDNVMLHICKLQEVQWSQVVATRSCKKAGDMGTAREAGTAS
jgi:hypothetical protein